MIEHRIFQNISKYLSAILLVALASLICETVRLVLAPTNMVMAYLLAVVLAAAKLGFKPAIMTAALSVLAFDILFVPPRFSLRVSDSEYLITFFALFVVGAVVSTLVSRIKEKVEDVKSQEARTSSLYYLTRDLSGAVDIQAIVAALSRAITRNFNSKLIVLVNQNSKYAPVSCYNSLEISSSVSDVVNWVVTSGRKAGAGTAVFSDSLYVYIPIRSSENVDGVMVLESDAVSSSEDQQLIEAFAGQVALAIERVQFSQQAEEARVMREKSQLEQALLNSISHDLRTPLVTISGVLDSMANEDQEYDPNQKKAMILAASEEATRLNRFVSSLLDMTRLEAGALYAHFDLCEVEEVIGCAVGAVKSRLGSNTFAISVETDLPPVPADLVLLTQALVNLLDNAIKFSPPSVEIGLTAKLQGDQVVIEIIDSGPGVPVGEEERIFDKFHMVKVPEATGGTGLGLSIAKGIIEAHKGTISASNRSQGGLIIQVVLPTDMTRLDGENHEQ